MVWTEEATKALKESALRYEERLRAEVEEKYRGSFHAISRRDVEEAVGRLVFKNRA